MARILPTLLLAVATLTGNEGVDFYKQSVEPVLRSNCVACHSEKSPTSGLSLETRESILRGGNRGAAIEPGKPDEGVLLQALRHAGDLKMPPGRRIKDEQIAAIQKWISMG